MERRTRYFRFLHFRLPFLLSYPSVTLRTIRTSNHPRIRHLSPSHTRTFAVAESPDPPLRRSLVALLPLGGRPLLSTSMCCSSSASQSSDASDSFGRWSTRRVLSGLDLALALLRSEPWASALAPQGELLRLPQLSGGAIRQNKTRRRSEEGRPFAKPEKDLSTSPQELLLFLPPTPSLPTKASYPLSFVPLYSGHSRSARQPFRSHRCASLAQQLGPPSSSPAPFPPHLSSSVSAPDVVHLIDSARCWAHLRLLCVRVPPGAHHQGGLRRVLSLPPSPAWS